MIVRQRGDDLGHGIAVADDERAPSPILAQHAARKLLRIRLAGHDLWREAEALRDTPAQVAYICNTTTQPGQTDGYSALNHVERLVELLAPGTLDTVLVNRSAHDPALLAHYAAEGIHLLQPTDDELARIAALGVQPLVRDYAEQTEQKRELWNKQDTIRHAPAEIGRTLYELASATRN